MGGVAYIAAKIAEPGVIAHTGTMARLRFGAVLPAQQAGGAKRCSPPARAPASTPRSSHDIRQALWMKFVFLVGACRG